MKRNVFLFFFIFIFISYREVIAQKKSLNSLLDGANYKSGLRELQKELEIYSSSKSESQIINIPEKRSILMFKKIGVGISSEPFSCLECIGTIIAYPQLIKEKIDFLGVRPNANIEFVLISMKKKEELIRSVIYYINSKELYVYLNNYYFIVNEANLISTVALKPSSNFEIEKDYLYFKDGNNIEAYFQNFKTLKVSAILTDYPPPVANF